MSLAIHNHHSESVLMQACDLFINPASVCLRDGEWLPNQLDDLGHGECHEARLISACGYHVQSGVCTCKVLARI